MAIGASILDTLVERDAFQTFVARYAAVPMVSLGELVPGLPAIIMDNYQEMYAAVAHLIEAHGCRRLAFVRGSEDHYYAQERYRAYTDALTAHGLTIDPRLISPPYDLWDGAHGGHAIRVLFDERGLRPPADFEAIVVANDTLALGALSALRTRGLRVPDDLAVTGFTDHPESPFTTPPLTSVAAPGAEANEPPLLVQHVRERSAELARQHYVLDTFMANVPDSIYFKDRANRFTRVNHALARLFSVERKMPTASASGSQNSGRNRP